MASRLVGDPNLYLAVEASRPSQRWVYSIGPVRCSDDDDVSSSAHTVHEGEQLGDDSPLNFACDLFSLRRNRIHFIDEYDAGCRLLGFLENLAKPGLRLSVEFRHDLGTRDHIEVGIRLVGHTFRKQGLAATRWPVEEDSLGRLDSQSLE